MKKLLVLFLVATLIACSKSEKLDYQTPKKVIIAGKIDSISTAQLDVALAVNRLGSNQTTIYVKADSLGNFHASFETYTPTDVWIVYKSNFLVLVHPGDSIYVKFNGNVDGKLGSRPKILKTIEFGGDAVKTNQDASKFQLMYFSNPLYNDFNAKNKAVKDYDLAQYELYLDTLHQKINNLYNKFVKEVTPNEEVKLWAKTYIESDYYYTLASYPVFHQYENKLTDKDWKVPTSYYDELKKQLPIKKSMFISGYALSNFATSYFAYVLKNLRGEKENQKYIDSTGYFTDDNITDSLILYGIIKYTPDSILKQMVLTEFVNGKFEKLDITAFEKYRKLIESNIKEAFLYEPLYAKYNKIKERIENPQIASDAMLKKIANSSAKHIMDSVIQNNKDKVIYMDCWATWCGPCKAEMPNSKKLMKEMQGKDVAFVYLCIDSQEKIWKATLAELQLTGQHYFLTQEQSNDLRKIFEINGVPYYFIINKNGVIIEKGSHLRPNRVKKNIEELLLE